MREMGVKELGQAYEQHEQVMERMNNYTTRPSALSVLTTIPSKTPLAFLRASGTIHKVYPSAKAVPVDQGIRSLGTSLETFMGEAIIINEEGAAKADDAGVQLDLWGRWVMDV